MHDPATRKIEEAQVAQRVHPEHRVATPSPTAFHRVDESRHDDGKGQKGEQLHALCHRARHNGHGRGDKHNLEEEIGRRCIGGIVFTTFDDARPSDRA